MVPTDISIPWAVSDTQNHHISIINLGYPHCIFPDDIVSRICLVFEQTFNDAINLMLTKKQIWRRTHSTSRRLQHCPPTVEIGEKCSDANKVVGVSAPPPPLKLKSALSSGNLSGMDKRLRNNREVRFSATVHVLLIPSRFELLTLCLNIYFTAEDYQIFRKEAVNEIREVARHHGIPVKKAMNYLYQPNYSTPREPSPDLTDDSHSHDEESSLDSNGAHGTEFGAKRLALESALHFIIRAKTDVELNATPPCPPGSTGAPLNRSGRRIPTRTTTSAPSRQHQLWAVQWKKQGETASGG